MFEDGFDLHQSEFQETLDLYGNEFCKVPDLSGCIFSSSNLIGVTIPTKYNEIQESIKQKVQLRKKEFDDNWTYKDFGYLSLCDYQDNFRGIKHLFLKENNTFEASKYHKAELYCKEIELDSKPKKTTREWIDWAQLFFYRQTSDHHTDLAKIFNNVIVLIALFGIYACALWGFKSTEKIKQGEGFSIVKIFSTNSFLLSELPNEMSLDIRIFCYALVLCSVVASVVAIKHAINKLSPHFDMRCLYFWFFLFGCGLWIPHLQEAVLILILCLGFVVSYLILLIKSNRWIIGFSYIVSVGILVFKPLLLLPFVGQLFDEGVKANFPAMQSLSVVYCILMFLMLFSLQKTARKNSIIPS